MLTYKTFISLINTEFNIKLNNKKMKLILNKIHITKKRIRRRLIKSVEFLNQIIENRKKFKEIIQKELIQNIISIDESGFNKLINSDTEGYSKIGTEINIPLPELTIKNTSLIMAVSIMGIINQEIIMDFVNKDVYFNFIKTTIEKLKSSYPDKQFIFIFDNVSFHHTNTTLELITKNNYKYYFIPPYSPNLNPIENIFGIIKYEINKDIMNNIINKKFIGNYKELNIKCNKERKENNKVIITNENIIKKDNIKKFRKVNTALYKIKIKNKIKIINNSNVDNKTYLINEIKNNMNIEKRLLLTNFIQNEKKIY